MKHPRSRELVQKAGTKSYNLRPQNVLLTTVTHQNFY